MLMGCIAMYTQDIDKTKTWNKRKFIEIQTTNGIYNHKQKQQHYSVIGLYTI